MSECPVGLGFLDLNVEVRAALCTGWGKSCIGTLFRHLVFNYLQEAETRKTCACMDACHSMHIDVR